MKSSVLTQLSVLLLEHLSNLRAIILLLIHGLWAFLLSLCNDFFAFGPIYFYLGGIFVILPAVRLDFARGFLCVVVTGCFLDAAFLTPFGFHVCGLVIALVILHAAYDHGILARRASFLLPALVINLSFFLALHIWYSLQIPEGGDILDSRALTDFMCSQILLVLSLRWLIQLYDEFLDLIGLSSVQ